MRHLVDRLSRAAVASLAAVPLLVAGCGKLTPQGGDPTMALLHDGSEKVCIASDVQKALRDLIVTKPADMQADLSLETRNNAAAAVSLSYDLTTLQSFDQGVSRASCNTTVTIRSANSEKTSKFRIDYQVSPSADSPGSFVVTADADDAHAFASDQIADEVDDVAAKAVIADQAAEEAQRKQALLAVISEKWLQGAWIDPQQPTGSCGNGQALWFEPAHVLEGAAGKGRWALAGDQLHMVGGSEQPFDTTTTITQADPISFTAAKSDGTSFSLRRCTRDETQTLPAATADTGSEQQ